MSAATRELRWHGRTDLVRLMLLSNGWTEPGAPVGSGARVLRPIKDVVLREADGVTYVLITLPIDQQLDMPTVSVKHRPSCRASSSALFLEVVPWP